MTGLRERKKQRTRDALIRTAHELFVEHGYETTTVDEIAEAVDVSQRTFFRYFASKEEVAFALQDLIEQRYFDAVRERPEGEPPLEVLRRPLDESWKSIGETVHEIVPIQLHMRMWQVIETTPALVSVMLRRSVEMEEKLSAEIARREGLALDADPRPRVLVAAFSGVMRAAGRLWGCGEDASIDAARAFVASYMDSIEGAFAGDWGEERGAREQSGGASAEPR